MSYLGQIGYVLLTDLAHNLLADFYHQALLDSSFEGYGLKRIVRDLLATPGRLIFDQDRLQRIELLSQKQYAEDLRICLERYCSGSFRELKWPVFALSSQNALFLRKNKV